MSAAVTIKIGWILTRTHYIKEKKKKHNKDILLKIHM